MKNCLNVRWCATVYIRLSVDDIGVLIVVTVWKCVCVVVPLEVVLTL